MCAQEDVKTLHFGRSKEEKHGHKPTSFIVIILMVQLALWLAMILNIPVIRQVVAFIYLTFVPGFLILKTLRINSINTIELLLFSVGLSIAFVMFIGLLANEFLPYLGISQPFSEIPITMIVSSSVLLLCFLNLFVYRNYGSSIPTETKVFDITHSIIFISLPFLSVVGAILANAFESNFVTILVMTIVLVVFLSILLSRKFHSKIYLAAILGIATALILQKTLISSYIQGFDIHREYYIFRITRDALQWTPITFLGLDYSSFGSMLSTTVLPTMCSTFLGIEPTWVLKIVYPLIYSLVPLGIYQLHRTQVGKKVAFVSTFFFMANYDVFLQPSSNAKQMIAGLFYVLLFLALFRKKTSARADMFVCLILFSFGVVTSHYATSYLFLILVAVGWLWGRVHHENWRITARFVLLIFLLTFSWYIFTPPSGPFNKIVDVGNQIYNNFFVEFFSIESRGRVVKTIVGSAPSLLHTISRLFFYTTLFFILIGLFALVTRSAGGNFNREYKTILYSAVLMLFAVIVVPNMAPSLAMSRFYNLLLILLAPLFVLGVQTFSRNLLRTRAKTANALLLMAIIVPFYLFQTGIIYEIGGDPEPTTPSLSIYRMGDTPYTNFGFVRKSDVFASTWLSSNVNITRARIYSDAISALFVLKSYGMIPGPYISRISNETAPTDGSYVYLAAYNGVVFVGRWRVHAMDVSNITDFLPFSNTLYSNGFSDIRYVPGNSASQ